MKTASRIVKTPSVKIILETSVSIMISLLDRWKIPFPTGQPSRVDTVKSKGEESTNNSAEVPEDCHKHYTRSHLIRTVPVAEL